MPYIIISKIYNIYKYEKVDNSVFKNDFIYFNYNLNDFMIIIHITIMHINNLKRYL